MPNRKKSPSITHRKGIDAFSDVGKDQNSRKKASITHLSNNSSSNYPLTFPQLSQLSE